MNYSEKTLFPASVCGKLIVSANSIMCEKRSRKFKKGSHITRLREARRFQRIQRMVPSPISSDDFRPAPGSQITPPIDKTVQNKVILELACKTVALMHKNKIIQQKIIDLQKETSEFVAALLKNPQNGENRLRYMSILRSQAMTAARAQDLSLENKENNNIFLQMLPAPNEA